MVHALLKASGESAAQGKMDELCNFVEQSTELDLPANVFVVLDTHAETDTGSLQYAGGRVNPAFAPASEVVRDYCGEVLIGTMHAANLSAQNQGPAKNPKWFDDF